MTVGGGGQYSQVSTTVSCYSLIDTMEITTTQC